MYREKINKILKENVDLTSRVRQAELEISTGNVINDFAFVEEIKPDYPLIILDAIKILNGKGMVFTSVLREPSSVDFDLKIYGSLAYMTKEFLLLNTLPLKTNKRLRTVVKYETVAINLF